MLNLSKRKYVDSLVDHFWKNGYLTVSRKFGTYLPEPAKVGDYDVDVIAKYKNSYAIGVTLQEDDFNDQDLLTKLNFLSTRQNKYTHKRVTLFVGVPEKHFKTAKALLENLHEDIRKNIRLFSLIKTGTSTKSKQTNIVFS